MLYASLEPGAYSMGHKLPSDLPKGVQRLEADEHGLQRLRLPPELLAGKRTLYIAAARTNSWSGLAPSYEKQGEEAVFQLRARSDRRTSPPLPRTSARNSVSDAPPPLPNSCVRVRK